MSIVRSVRDLPVPPEAVFAAFQDPARLARWWGPEGFTNTFHAFAFHDGGGWDFTMHGPDGTDYPNQSAFLEVAAPRRIRIRHLCLPRFDLTITLEAIPGGTRLTWEGVFENAAFVEANRAFLETANEQNLNRLAAEVRAGG